MERSEAIEIVREHYPSSGKDLNEALETLIPELKESEDEKVRKELIYFHRNAIECLELPEKKDNNWEIEQHKKYIAWLEKQGSQNLANSEKTCKVEQKSADKVEPIEGEFPYDNPADTLEGEIDNIWRKVSCDNRFSATKEGFEEVIHHFINFVRQKTAWSEEDEEKFRDVIRLVEQGAPVQSIRDHYTNWLKSLKERYTWKPSDEQINALARFTTIPALESLYNDLKKLKG